jgi:hypothetical protein
MTLATPPIRDPEPLPPLSRADSLRVADALERFAADLDASDPDIAAMYRRDAARIRGRSVVSQIA